MTSCIFCDILAGKVAANIVYRDEVCAAFMDIHPVNPGHVLVVPFAHAATLAELDEQTAGHMLQVAQRVDAALRSSGLRCEGVNLLLADGQSAGQSVMHIHLHVVPRFSGDGHHLHDRPSFLTGPSDGELQENAEMIRKQLGGNA
jgi:histidine triad (HIT) family protein